MSRELELARGIARTLIDAGHEAFFAGGCVRDRLLGLDPADIDVATSARPEEVEALFRRTLAVGKQFGVIVVVMKGCSFEVATFRTDGAYVDGRRPETVTFTTAVEDVKRRDFTINGLLWNPVTDEIIDHVGGRADLEAGVVRTIGDPVERFTEDRLRILRAIRFAVRLGFSIDEATAAAIRSMASVAAEPSAERILGELGKMLTETDPARALDVLDELGLLDVVLPEVAAKRALGLGARFGGRTALDLTREGLAALGPGHGGAAFALLLDDLAAASPGVRARAAEGVLRRLRASNGLIAEVRALVTCRDRMLFADRVSHARRAVAAADPHGAVRREHARALLDSGAAAVRALDDLPAPAELPPPLLDGRELMALGVPPGKGLGRVVKILRHRQLDGVLQDAHAAREWVRRRL